jgi:hypothetical protein
MAPFLSYKSKYFLKPGIINIFPVKQKIMQIIAKIKKTKLAIGNINKSKNTNGVNDIMFKIATTIKTAIVNKIPFLA